MKTGFLLVFILAMSILSGMAQTRVITGTVISSEDGLPIPGVSILAKGTTVGTVSNKNGEFSIALPQSSQILVFSFIGMTTQEVPITSDSKLKITLIPGNYEVGEVVVTALGISKEKKSLTYSATEVKSDELVKANEANVVTALSGKVAGVQVSNSSGMAGSSSRILIRGVSSLQGNNQPLFVVDGVPFNNQEFNFDENDEDQALFYGSTSNTGIDIDPNQIASMTVLKGAAATALYGSRAANGVILITTKSGMATKAPVISFSSRFSLDKIRPAKTQELYGLGTNGNYVDGETQKSSWVWGPKLDTTDIATYDRWDLFQIGKTYENSLSVQGGTDKAGYFASFGALNQTGTVPNNSLDRYNMLTKFDTKLNDKLSIGAKMEYISTTNERLSEGNAQSSIMWTIMTAPPTYNLYPAVDANGVQRLWRTPTRNNPYWLIDNTRYTDVRDRFIPTFNFEYAFLSWLKAKGNFGVDYYSSTSKYYENTGNRGSYPTGRVLESARVQREVNSDLMLVGDKSLSDKIKTNFLLGHNINSQFYHVKSIQGTDFIIPGFYNLSNTKVNDPSEGTTEKRMVSLYGSATFSYENYLYLTVTGRNDWSSTLPENNNSYFYPSISSGLIFSDAFGLKNDWFDFGKVRISYARVGNDAPPYSTVTSYNKAAPGDGQRGVINFPYNGIGSYLQSNVMGNPLLKPEITKEFEIGLDLKFFHDRASVDLAYYDKTSQDQIFSAPTASETGFGFMVVNAAEIKNEGIEALVNVTPVKIKDFRWDISVNYSKNNNKVLSLTEGVSSIRLAGFDSPGIFIMANQPYGVIWGKKYLRNEKGEILVDDDGFELTADESGAIGNAMPNWIGGMRNTITWKGLSVSALIDTRQGGDIFNLDEYYTKAYGTSWLTRDREHPIVVKGIRQSDGAVNTTEVTDFRTYWSNQSNIDEANVQDASFIRLRDVSVSYDLPKSTISKLSLKGLIFTVSGRNLWLKTSEGFTGSDPENSLYGSGNGQGISNFAVPSSKSINFSLKLTF
jgi:TonB-linked SusC/RagA family outer membrane protein